MNIIPNPNRYYHGKPDKREIPRIKLATIVTMDSSRWDLELSKPANAPEMEKLLSRYQDQSLESNLFFEKTFLAAAFGRMNTRETSLLTVWESIDNKRFLRMYFPVVQERMDVMGENVWRCWSHNYAPLGVPIVSQHDAGEVLDRFLQLIAQIENAPISALVFPDIPLSGVFATRMREALDTAEMPYGQVSVGKRAVLHRNMSGLPQDIIQINSKMRRNYRRQQKRLSELGEFSLERVNKYKDVILRFEEFLLLEATGWKRRKGTSMLTVKQTAAFARQAVTELSKYGQCAIYSLRLGGKSIASLIVLNSNGVYFPWKIAINPEYSLYSPGALLMVRVSEEMAVTPDFIRMDSLASSSNQLVNPLWKQRMELGSMILPIGNTARPKLEKISDSIKRSKIMRIWGKKLLMKNPR